MATISPEQLEFNTTFVHDESEELYFEDEVEQNKPNLSQNPSQATVEEPD